MRLEPLYRVRFTYPQGWEVELEGGWQQHLYVAHGRCEGALSGRFQGTNYPRRRTENGPFCPDLRAVIDTDDGATIMFECHGYGRAYPQGGGKSWAWCSTSATMTATAASTTWSACVSGKCEPPLTQTYRAPIW